MKSHIPLFRFTLGEGQSIGPSALRSLWILACKSVDVSVGRDVGSSPHAKPVYVLCAPSRLPDLPAVERRLRRLLEEADCRTGAVARGVVRAERATPSPSNLLLEVGG